MTFFRTLCMALAIVLPGAASAQAYPAKPAKIIVPYAAGGTGDILARLIAQELTKQTGQSFVVENRTGAGGLIGYGAGAKSAGDGYTLVAMDSSYTMFPGLYGERVDWNIETDLVPVSMYARAAFALAVNPAKNYKLTEDLVRAARDKPGAVSFGTPGIGTLHHVFTSLLVATTGTQMTHVPYRGASEALNAVLGNNVDWTFVAMPTITGQLGNERLRVLAVTSENRSPLLPNVPTLRESGIAMTVANWFGLGTPKGTPPEVVAFLHKQVSDAVKSPEVAARMRAMGAEPVGNSPAEFNQIMRADLKLWTKVIKDAGIKN
jgi:tripartite-type tricarboxylate transporter receptor subunit TctC